MDAVKGSDVVLVPTGGPPTIDLKDLWEAIWAIRPRIVIPMHYWIPGCKVKMFPIAKFVEHISPVGVTFCDKPFVDLSRDNFTAELQVIVLQPSHSVSKGC